MKLLVILFILKATKNPLNLPKASLEKSNPNKNVLLIYDTLLEILQTFFSEDVIFQTYFNQL